MNTDWLKPGRSEGCRVALMAVVISGLVGLIYWPAIRGAFIWDDVMLVQHNLILTGQFTVRSIWFRTDFPLSTLLLWLQWHVWGNNPTGYHAVNLLLHVCSAMLLWRVLLRLRVPGAWLAAIIFAVHPVCVASVAWIAEVKNALSLPFYLLSILCYVHFEEHADAKVRGKAAVWYSVAILAFFLALLSKTTTVMLPPVLIVYAWWRRGRFAFVDVLRTAPFFLLALAFGLLSIIFQAQGAIRGATVQTLDFWGRLAGAGMALWFYLAKALCPLNLMMIYPRWEINATAVLSYLPILLWVALLGICWVFRRTWGRHALFALGSFTIALFPVLGFLSMYYLVLSRVSDHFEYLPLVSIVALLAAWLSSRITPGVVKYASPVLVFVLASLTLQRTRVFSNEEALWRDNLAKNPNAWTAQGNLGWILAEQKNYAEAQVHLRKSLDINPDNAQAHANLGHVLVIQGNFGDAETQFAAALKLKPNDAEISRSYATAFAENGRKDEAIKVLREFLKSRPDADARLQLATWLYETGQFPAAIVEYRQAVAARPDAAEALSNLAWLLATSSDASLRNGKDAVDFAQRACRLTDFKEAQPVGVLAAAYAEAGDFSNAVVTAQQAIELATVAGDRRFAALNRQLLRLYQSGAAYHEPPPRNDNPGAR
jgi:Flp pilus assembly protein TadD